MECLKELIGIIKGDCPCTTGPLTEAQKVVLAASKSGLYLEDLEGGLTMRALTSLENCKGFSEMALGARDSAIQTLEADVFAALALKYKSGAAPFVGTIGRPSYTTTLKANKRYQFLKLKPQRLSDAVMLVTGLRIIVDRGQALKVMVVRTIQDGNQGEVILNETINSVVNSYVSVPLPQNGLSLPLAANGESLEYYVVWDRGATTGEALPNPKDIKADCNCGFKKAGFTDYVAVNGGELDDLNSLQSATKDVYTHGVSIDADIRCMPGDLICREYDRENAISLTMAYAARYKAGENLIEAVMSSPEVNRYTMMNREYLWGKRSHFKKEYENRITYLADVMDVTSSDCFICRDVRMFKGLIS